MIPKALRSKIFEQGRHRCCLHRLAWLDIAVDDPGSPKWRPLEIHHVIFQSCGGTDEPDNLVPLCPSCHALIHGKRRIGGINVDDEKLRDLWGLWVRLASVVPSTHHVGIGPPAAAAKLVLNVYGLEVNVTVDDMVSFSEARSSLLDASIGVLAAADPYFPFPSGRLESASWETSFDGILKPWNRHPAAVVFANAKVPLRATAPVVITLDTIPRPQLYGSEEQRTI